MAFHVACPITCRKICTCALGFPAKLRDEKGRNEFLQEVDRIEQFLKDPWLIKSRENATVQVKVPKVVVSPAPAPPPPLRISAAAGGGGDEAAKTAAVKRAALQKQAAAASMEAEDYARRFESGDLGTAAKDVAGDEQGNPNAKIMCRLCFSGEDEGSERAGKMLSCNSCGKKYHRSCLKAWSQNRDLFHWSSWTCPSCRTCEVCRRTGDPTKFSFCKRCDGAYHCYCQQPPHKNVGHGPYLCPKHTKCHSCDSTVPGNGLSVRWFLGHTCCDACGRLFVKGNYCPVCLKVYRDSESTPMVCCDTCQSWVHCTCDGISDAKYTEFELDGNLQYVCPTCRGECSQVKNIDEAVKELWRRRNEADKDLIASLRAAAGLPTEEEIFNISPFSDDEESEQFLKPEPGSSFKFKSPKKSKDYRKKSSKKYAKKKRSGTSSTNAADQNGQDEASLGYDTGNNKKQDTQFFGTPDTSPVIGSVMEVKTEANEAAASELKFGDEVIPTNVTKAMRTVRIKSNKYFSSTNSEEIETNSSVPKAAQGPKLVINLGGLGRNTATPPRSEAPSIKRQDLILPNGSEDTIQPKHDEQGSEVCRQKDHRTYLKFKIPRNVSSGNHDVAGSSSTGDQDPVPDPIMDEYEITYTRGQRSKRRRPVAAAAAIDENKAIEDLSDANWILLKLGKDAAGKRVEVHQPSDDSWPRGTVVEVSEGTSMVSIAFDYGKTESFELGKLGIRFVSQKPKI
ncbi:uncharacterized protein LOC127261370 isoform X2 [Andrographis paniculata]|uniref:uncharacterized protein LOC127261370 isoform X2 n=1 Tax=Andrographis paniculata TaxID=175694 RepID=UPI0021E71959|nr:uncharacterized protein LOC127261370 isoform X2 [Andrographis paniculata]